MTWMTGTTELAPGVFAYVQEGGGMCIANAGIIAGSDGTTVIDALFTQSMTRALLDETSRISPAPITRLIDTHHHIDHTLGNSLFPATTQIVAHERAQAEMQRVGLGMLEYIRHVAPHFGDELSDVRARLPDVTFADGALELHVGSQTLRLLHFGTSHTRGDVLVHFPEQRILFAGDVAFFYVTPLAFEGHIGNWLTIGRRIIDEVDAITVVPGHGPVGSKHDLARMLGYLELVYGHSRQAFDAGAAAEEAARTLDLGEYGEWAEPERLVANVERCYQEFRGELDAIL